MQGYQRCDCLSSLKKCDSWAVGEVVASSGASDRHNDAKVIIDRLVYSCGCST